jgi:hypothetical protein
MSSKFLFRYLVYNLHDSTVQTDTLPKSAQFIVDLQQGAYSYDGQNWTPIHRRPRVSRTLITAALLLFSVLAFAQPRKLPTDTAYPTAATQPYFQHPQRFVLAGQPTMFVCPDVSARPWASISTNGIILHVNAAGQHYQYPLSMAEVEYDVDGGLMIYTYTTTDSRLQMTFSRDGNAVSATFAGGEVRERPNLLFILENILP